MERYTPPFSITNTMLELVSDISEKIGSISNYNRLENKPHLRKNNRIKSIHSSLRIEANSLSLSEVRDVINGKVVLGDSKEITEVKNAYKAYSEIGSIDPYSLDDLKKIHGIMTTGLLGESGVFRVGQEGVFDGDKCIFLAPPPELVPELMENLFAWMNDNKQSVHPLILASIFHYEFVFIHPFADGNGRMARLWHTVILSKWRSIFEYIPIESQIENFQQDYYNAIATCHANGTSNVFIEFMLKQIDTIIEDIDNQMKSEAIEEDSYVGRLINVMEIDVAYTTVSLMNKLGMKSRNIFRNNYLHPAIEAGFVKMTLPEQPTSRNQKYIRVR